MVEEGSIQVEEGSISFRKVQQGCQRFNKIEEASVRSREVQQG